MSLLILVIDDEPDVESLFRQQFRRELRSGRFIMEFAHSACEALDRGQEARQRLQEDGSFFTDRHGSPRPHPALAVARDASITFSRVLRELDLDGEPGPDPRPPRRP